MPISNSKNHPEEWAYFVKMARRFDDEPSERRYGIPKMEAKTWDDMLFSHDAGILFQKFITEGTIGAQVHDHVLKMEILEGKKPASILNRRRY